MRDEYSKRAQKGKITKHGRLSMCFLSHSRSFSVDFNAKVSLDMIKLDCFEFKFSMLKRSSKILVCFNFKLILAHLLCQFAQNVHGPPWIKLSVTTSLFLLFYSQIKFLSFTNA
jgi:hypothetical protein